MAPEEPRLLFSVNNIRAFHLQDGAESEISPTPQVLSLLMVPTSSPFADLSSAEPQSRAPEEDFYLHLHLPPELDLSLPATTQVFHQPPRSYLIPRWDLGPESGAFTRIEFPKIGTGQDRVTQEDVDTFETILAQCTAFLERAQPPTAKGPAPYNPADYAPGEGYVGTGSSRPQGQIVLIDEEDGSVVGELSGGMNVVPGSDVKPGSKSKLDHTVTGLNSPRAPDPVEIQLPQDGQSNSISVHNVSEEYLKMARHPAYKNSTIVQNAATASRLIVTGSGYIANAMQSGASSFATKTKPNPKPMTFSPTTQERIRKLNNLTHGAVGISATTVGQVGKIAQSFGARLGGHKDGKANKGKGDPGAGYKPGVMNKSMIAFSTIADGIEQSAKNLLNSGSAATSTVISHRYGAEAGAVAAHLAGGIRNVGLVYIDATGVSRKAVIKSVGKGMVVGRTPDGGQVVVGEGDGGTVPPEMIPKSETAGQPLPGIGAGSHVPPGSGQVGFGNAAPPSYGSGIGEPLGGQALQGQQGYPPEKQ